jgi:hypothetical protein
MLSRIAGPKVDQERWRAILYDDLPGRSRRARKFHLMVDWASPARLPLLFAPSLTVSTALKEFSVRATSIFVALLLAVVAGRAQVLAPEEIRDPEMRALQQKYRNELKLITSAAAAHSFPYNFYFSRKLDLEEKDQKQSDQRSVQFDRYQGRVVLKITGNYFASYSAELFKPEERARQTYESVMLPLLRAAVQALEKADVPQAFALEISHHVRKKMLGVSSEGVENVVLVLPKESAKRLVTSADPRAREAAVFEGEAYLNTKPISFWPRPEETSPKAAASKTPPADGAAPHVAAPDPAVSSFLRQVIGLPNVAAKVAPERLEQASPTQDSTPEAVKDLQKTYQPALDRMVQELESQAHFVSYAPPAFIPFHNGVYLQVSVSTTLAQAPAGSQYKQAALAFDQHIAHLIRPVLAYFKERRGDFDGIDFSTTVRFASGQGADASPLAVEFISPLKPLSAYAGFDSTGQQLIDASFVLINGERVSLNLQAAETGSTAQ